jgi:hypothetical protein
MGNGFTFQLESLIFFAVALCCAEYHHLDTSQVSAYGDDVIIPTACLESFAEMLDFYGFVLNKKKSHSDSMFRESCGAHFFSGRDVKPIYLKGKVTSVPAVYRLANAIRRQAHRHNNRYGCDVRFRAVFDLLVASVPKSLRFRIPNDLGDGGFISNFDEASPSRARHGLEGFRVVNVVDVSKTYEDETIGYLLAALWSLRDNRDLDFGFREHVANVLLDRPIRAGREAHTRLKAITSFIEPKGQVRQIGEPSPSLERYNAVSLHGRTRYKRVNSLVQRWYDLGPWI